MVGVAARLSTDTGNALTFGTDNGLFGTATTAANRGGHPFWTLDNSWAAGGTGTTYWYGLGGGTNASMSLSLGTAWLWPLMVAKNARFSGLLFNVSTAGAGSTIYNSLYASDAAGLPSTKISDVASLPGTTAGPISATVLDTTTVLAANVQYWMCTWAYSTSAAPTITGRSPGITGSIRLAVQPTSTNWWSQGALSFLDTTSGWTTRTSAPASLTLAAHSASGGPGNAQYAPFPYFGLINT